MMYDATSLQLDFGQPGENSWFMNRFADTVGVYKEQPVTIYDCGRFDGTNFVYASEEGFDNKINIDEPGLLLGVPEHGYVNVNTTHPYQPVMVDRTLYDKWKWGWQPGSDSSSRYWTRLIKPNHKPIAKTKGDVAITHSFCVSDNRLINYDGYKVGNVEEDEQGRFVILDKRCLFLLEDIQLKNIARLKK